MAEINSRETLEAWLQDKPREWGAAIAHRTALRMLTIALNPQRFRDHRDHLFLIMAVLRLSATLRISLIHSALKVASYSAQSAHAAALIAADVNANAQGVVAVYAGISAPITYHDDDSDWQEYVSHCSSYVADVAASYPTFRRNSAGAAAHAAGAAVWDSIQHDCDALDGGVSPVALLSQPLWAGALPDWIEPEIRAMETHLTSLGMDFDLWIDWYRRRIIGDASGFGLPPGPEEELSRRLIEASDEWWKREPALVNGDIKAWIAELAPEPDFEVIKERLQSGARLQFGSPKEQRLRADLQQQIEALQAQLDGIDPPPPPIGHNLPPIDLDEAEAEDAPAVFNELRSLTAEVKTAIQPSEPDLPATVEKLSRLQRLYRWLKKLAKESVEDFVKEGAKSAGKWFGPAALGIAVLPTLQSVFSAASAWLHALF